MEKRGTPTSIRLTKRGENLLEKLVEKYGVSKTAIIEIAIREKAERDLTEEYRVKEE